MRIVVLDDSTENVQCIDSYIREKNINCDILHYRTIFSLITGIYDEYKGDVDVVFVCLSREKDKRILMAKDLQCFFSHIKVLFYSADNDIAEEIFQAFPSFFSRLPFTEKKLDSAFNRIIQIVDEDNEKSISVKMGGKLFKIKFSSIRYIKSQHRKVIIYADHGYYETYMTLMDILKELPPYFIRCHRSFVVNTHKINSVSVEGIFLNKQEFIPLSKPYYIDVKNKLKNIQGEVR